MTTAQKKKILIVDDEAAFTRILKLNLESTGLYQVLTENNGGGALKAAQSFRPDLIFMDVIMPDVAGPDAAESILGDSTLAKVPIVFITATVTSEELVKTNGVIGGRPFLSKPVNIEQVKQAIRQYCP